MSKHKKRRGRLKITRRTNPGAPAGALVSDPHAPPPQIQVIGIAPEDLPHVVERFYRGKDAEVSAGSGIGLAVASELVAAHGGTIEAGNRPEGGAAFTVRLPRG